MITVATALTSTSSGGGVQDNPSWKPESPAFGSENNVGLIKMGSSQVERVYACHTGIGRPA